MSLVDRATSVADSLARLRGDELYQYLPSAIEELTDLHRDYAQAFCEDQAEGDAAPAQTLAPQLVDKGPFPFRYAPSVDPQADGLYECLIRDERWEVDGVPLSPDQVNAAMSVLASRTDITIFTGPAGAGKTFVIRWLVSVGLMQICAMTARAAVPYGAVTVDALFCINRESGEVWSEDLLARNPLLDTRLVRQAAGDSDPDATCLAGLVSEAIDALRQHPRDDKLLRAVEATYLTPAPTQEAAAARLGLPFSTYRRHLTQGTERIAAWLWEREVYGPGGPR